MKDNLIYDLGLHRGEDSEFYLKKGFSVVAVEANPTLASETERRLQSYVKSGQLVIENKAISDRDCVSIPFYVCDNVSVWGTTQTDWVERNRIAGAEVRQISVPSTRFASLIARHGVPYYLKMDIEGADTLCLRDLRTIEDRPKFISLESSLSSFEELIEEFCLFQALGYTLYKIVPQHQVNKQRLPQPAREGTYVAHAFAEGSSGAFGDELPGEWIDLEAAIRRFVAIYRKHRLTGPDGSLSKLTRRVVNTGLGARQQANASPMKLAARKSVWRLGAALGLRAGWFDTHAKRG
jgi:FkbM family methyltransferase